MKKLFLATSMLIAYPVLGCAETPMTEVEAIAVGVSMGITITDFEDADWYNFGMSTAFVVQCHGVGDIQLSQDGQMMYEVAIGMTNVWSIRDGLMLSNENAGSMYGAGAEEAGNILLTSGTFEDGCRVAGQYAPGLFIPASQ